MVDMEIPKELTDGLARMFLMQENLNDLCFEKQGIRDGNGNPLQTVLFRVEQIDAEIAGRELTANSLSVTWMRNYLGAMLREAEETGAELPWKWWSKGVIDMSKAREEIIDVWHFLISLTLASGLDHESLSRAYAAKYAVNVKRQQTNYVANGDNTAQSQLEFKVPEAPVALLAQTHDPVYPTENQEPSA